jgi:spore coat polysaccharide biosynthesis protein SpsF
MNSQRLSGKVMLKILEKPVLWHIYHRLKSCKNLDNVVISTGERKRNKEICDFAEEFSIPYYSGSEVNLIERLYETAKKFNASSIIRVTGDCPLVEPDVVDQMISEYKKSKNGYDVITNSFSFSFPHGLEIELWSTNILKKLNLEIKEPEFKEWFPIYVKNNSNKFKILEIKNKENLSKFRLTLDYQEDFKLIEKIYGELYNDKIIFKIKDTLLLLEKKPELMKINSKYVGEHNIDAPKN